MTESEKAALQEWHNRNCHDCGGNCILLDNETVGAWLESERTPAEEKV